MRVTVLSETTINPITKMGERAGICWGADITDTKKNYRRGMDCLESNHGRVFEYVDVELCIEDISARVIREYYTHLGGSPTRLQASTRYSVDEDIIFEYVTPSSIKNLPETKKIYNNLMTTIWDAITQLKSLGVPNEDVTMLLPLGSTTKIVDKRNLRNHIDMSHTRLCKRAYWEYRDLEKEIMRVLSDVSDEWKYIVDNYFVPNCVYFGKCKEKKSCGLNN